ncbi:glycerophosphodiester phosphodiesterase [Rhodoplanes serenus]|uniref:Glycerophosphodiester phosphodiesterase n=1 Tax=Rhodoplanes serenus TaxID=200615 RepID=A0A9X4XJE1_9BRAD|nr:glycerophosphodiester phosphodiesterase family protein [Rhodoplanes serenus]MTW15682.1 glycerophosphodiester phosphodiesterase [Rhodoplanes serenus]
MSGRRTGGLAAGGLATTGLATSGLGWLVERPIAHRGLHDAAAGLVENSAAAVAAALEAGYGIEVDLQRSRDGDAMVHHDDRLGRLVEGSEPLADLTSAALQARRFHGGGAPMMTLAGLLDRVDGRVPLLLEIKSRFDGDLRLARRVAALVSARPARVAVMSFDPALVAALAAAMPAVPHGLVGQSRRRAAASHDPAPSRLALAAATLRAAPRFLAWNVDDLGTWPPRLARALGRPVLTWTVRSEAVRRRALDGADQVIFEGFRA